MLKQGFRKAVGGLIARLKNELQQQGHRATGRLINSVSENILDISDTHLVSEILIEEYYRYVNDGVPANRIPYGGRSGRGGTSKYIQALINWAKVIRPTLSEKEAKSFAFAVAAKHKKEGMPTRGSYAYSNNGRRLKFIETVTSGFEQELENTINFDDFANEIVATITKN